ncbi:zinc-binding dehydrogenase [Arthrobacter burdickii]|uniref:Zinc-binding dehydrogenase n=1 Tax=Arthrobacter burdickii TaxID=3035920 RepID=A0ABT8K656_9MICC|nr:zinc-binding dehydrogenase [Arthrobacter burdickii]MDN4612301.1 zinc-binding dehydrogenase [Arthrobacter burdickii]
MLSKVGAADVPFDVADLIACSVVTDLGAVVNDAGVEAGTSAVVVGTGGVGLSIIMALRLVGANPIIAVDLSEEKLAAAREFGATNTLQPSDGLAEEVRTLTGGGAAYAFEAIGGSRPSNPSHPSSRRAARPSSWDCHPRTAPCRSTRSRRAASRSSAPTTVRPCRGGDFPRLAALYLAGRLPVDRLISHRIGLDEVNEAFDAIRRGERARSVIVFGQSLARRS